MCRHAPLPPAGPRSRAFASRAGGWTLLGILLLAGGPFPAAGAVPPLPIPPDTTLLRFTLDNGLSVIVAEDETLPRFLFRLHFPLPLPEAGGGVAGAATAGAVAELLTRGTSTRSALGIAREVEGLDGHLAAGVDGGLLVLSLSLPDSGFSRGLGLFAEAARSSTFPEDQVESTLREQRARLASLANDPDVLGDRFFRLLVLEGHQAGWPASGPLLPDTLTRGKLTALRDQVVTPAGAVLLVAGPHPASEVAGAVREAFSAWEGATSPLPAPGPRPSVASPAAGPGIHLVHRPGSTESVLVAGTSVVLRPGVEGAEDAAALEAALGVGVERIQAGLGSALEGTVDGAVLLSASLVRRPGPWAVRAGLRVPSPAIVPVVARVLRELDALGQVEPTEASLHAARDWAARARGVEGSTAVLGLRLAEAELQGWPAEAVLDEGTRIREVTPAEVAAAARRYLPPGSAAVVVVADARAVLEGLEALAPVSLWGPDGVPLPRERVSDPRPAPPATWDGTRLREGIRRYGLRVEGREVGTSTHRLERDGDTWVATTTVRSPGAGVQETVIRFASEGLRPLGMEQSQSSGPLRLGVSLEVAGGRIRGAVSLPEALGGDRVLDLEAGDLLLPGMDEYALAVADLFPGARIRIPYLDVVQGERAVMEAFVTGRESLEVPAGTFESWRVEVASAQGTLVLFLHADAPHLLLEQRYPPGTPATLVLTGSSPL